MSGGYMGRLLFVDLTTGKMQEEAIPEEMRRQFIGGYGFGAKVLLERQAPLTDPLGPEAFLGFVAGPLTGTPAYIGSRYTVVGKSPKTLTWGDANSGGYFGPEMKFAGYDGVFFSGQAASPVYLLLENGKAELREAADLWGKDTYETEDLLQARHGKKAKVACIGPAGERASLLSCIINDKGRAAGRSGLGAIMGSKRLKAICALGSAKVPVVDPEAVKSLRLKYQKMVNFYDILRDYGTCGIAEGSAMNGDTPVRNWGGIGDRDFPGASRISDKAVIALQERRFACWGCPIACGGHVRLKEIETHKPEYETLGAFGTSCLNDDLESIVKVNDICNRVGLDTISTGGTVAFAIECFENGLLTKKDTQGLELRWGNAAAIVALTEQIAAGEGLAGLLGNGVKAAADKIGSGAEEYAVHIGGEEVPMHDPKLFPGLAATYAMDATPARHTQGSDLIKAPSGLPVADHDRMDYAGRGHDQNVYMSTLHLVNAAGICEFGHICMDAHALPEFMAAVTGWSDFDLEEAILTGERIGTLRHLFNLREGINPLTFAIPKRMLRHPQANSGPHKGVSVDLDLMRRELLEELDWDKETARPSPKKLKQLGLDKLSVVS